MVEPIAVRLIAPALSRAFRRADSAHWFAGFLLTTAAHEHSLNIDESRSGLFSTRDEGYRVGASSGPLRSYVIRETGQEHRGTMRFNSAVSCRDAHELRIMRSKAAHIARDATR